MERCNKKRFSTSMRTKNGAVFHKRTAPPFLRIADIFDDILHSFLILGVLLHVFDHLAGCVDDGGVVAPAKLVADGSHRHLGDLTDDVHGDLPRVGDLGGALGGSDILRLTPKVRPTSEMIRSTVTGIGWLSVRFRGWRSARAGWREGSGASLL